MLSGLLNFLCLFLRVFQPAECGIEIAFGTAAAGTVSTPFIWDAANEQANSQFHRFAVTLTKDLMATNGTVALPLLLFPRSRQFPFLTFDF